MMKNKLATFFFTATTLLLMSCSKTKKFQVPELLDPPVLQKVIFKDLAEQIPAYGISIRNEGRLQSEVNVEAEDSPKLMVGEPAIVRPVPSQLSIRSQVSRVMKSVSAETGQSLAWLDPIEVSSCVPTGEFIYASIVTGIRHHVLTVPRRAILLKEGKTMVIREQREADGKKSYTAQPVVVGLTTEREAEIKSGLKADDQIVVQGGIGFLYPNFKANAED